MPLARRILSAAERMRAIAPGFCPDLCSSRHQMVDVALLMRYIPHSCNWGENRRSAASICDLDHSEGNHGSTFPPVRSRPYGLWAKSCGWWTRRRRRRSRRPFGGGCYISPHFSQQISHWGMALSSAFPHQPQGNGVIERFFRTLKEQAIWGRTFRTAAEVWAAVSDFVARYNAAWRLERLGYLSPLDYRNRHLQQESRAA